MNTSTNVDQQLAEFESKAYQSLWNDGLVDLCLGIGILTLAASWITHHAVFGAILPALMVPLWHAARRVITEPRAGYVELNAERTGQLRLNHAVLAGLGVVALMMGIGLYLLVTRSQGAGLDLSWSFIPALPALLLSIATFVVAVLYKVPRFYFYGAVLLLSGLLGGLIGLRPGWHFVVPGLTITGFGTVLLISFLRRNPSRPEASSR